MSRLSAGDTIPQVAIQPYASPIQTNVQPAPGQPLQGNALQQLAESLSVFNNGLMAWAQAKNTQINRQAAEAGAAVDFSQTFAKDNQLNKSFRQIVSEMNLPDSANPYFLAAAERNFGAYAAMKVRNGVLSRMAELSSPDLDSSQQANLLNQIIAEESQKWGSQRFNGNFYASNAFNETVNSFFPEIERQANELYLRNKESQAFGDVENVIADYLTVAKNDKANSDQFGRQVAGEITGLQQFTTDPEKIRSVLFRSVVTAFQGADTEEEIENIMSAALDLPYGQGKTVADNMGLYAQLAAARSRAEDDIERKADQEDRRFRRATAAAVRSLGETGFDRTMVEAIQSGADTTAAFNAEFDKWREQNPDLPEAVVDAVYQDKFSLLAQLTQNQRAITRGDDTNAANRIYSLIIDGSISTLSQAVTLATELGVNAGSIVPVFEAYNDGSRPQLGSRANMLTQTLADAAENSGVPFDMFGVNSDIFDETTQAVGEYINSEDYRQILSTNGKRAAKTALDQFERQKLEEIRQRYETQFLNKAATREQRQQGETARLIDVSEAKTPAAREELVATQEATIIKSFESVYEALTYLPDNPYTRRYSSPDAVSNRISMLLEQEGDLEVSLRLAPEVVSGMPVFADRNKRVVEVRGDTFIVKKGFTNTEVARFSRRQMIQYAVDLRMQTLAGISVDNVLQNTTGVPGVSLEAFKAQSAGQRFPWESVPVFGSRQELDDMMNRRGYTEEQYGQFLNVILNGDLSNETVAAFRDRQSLLLDNRDLYRNAAR